MEVIGNIYSEKDRRVVQLNMRDLTERKRFEREFRRLQSWRASVCWPAGLRTISTIC
jgi:hypothetical protein